MMPVDVHIDSAISFSGVGETFILKKTDIAIILITLSLN